MLDYCVALCFGFTTNSNFTEMKSKKSPTINVPRKVEQEVEDFSDKDEIINTATKNVSPSERKNTFTNVVSNETQEVKKISKNDSVVNTQGKAMRHSPPTKQVNSPKNVRFKDDVLEETKLQETLPKQFSHSDGKVGIIHHHFYSLYLLHYSLPVYQAPFFIEASPH